MKIKGDFNKCTARLVVVNSKDQKENTEYIVRGFIVDFLTKDGKKPNSVACMDDTFNEIACKFYQASKSGDLMRIHFILISVPWKSGKWERKYDSVGVPDDTITIKK